MSKAMREQLLAPEHLRVHPGFGVEVVARRVTKDCQGSHGSEQAQRAQG
jgi:hypothetical protein